MTPATAASAPLARNDYREGQVLRARDLERESGYFLARDRQHAALAHIPGILRGLRLEVFERGTENAVAPENVTGDVALDLFLQAGVAVDGYGRMVGVPRREQLRAELATSPALLREGRYRVELLYDRTTDGRAGSGGASSGPCAGMGSAAEGGSRTVRERYRLRLVDAARPVTATELGPVLDGPPDAPEHEAPVVLGTVDWNGADAFVGFSLQGRVYAGVRAEVIASPDERTEVDLRDPRGNVAVRFAPEAAPGQAPVFVDGVRIDDGGGVWVRDDVSVGPEGLHFRPSADAQVKTNWTVGLRDDEVGSSFGKKPGSKPGEEVDVGAPPEYAAGEREMRVVFERADTPLGRRRVVIGHVTRDGGPESFRPAVIVYDRPPESENRGASTVEVWGDLFVRGTAYLTGAQRVEPGGTPKTGIKDSLDLLLRQLAGPMADALRAFLLGDPDWLNELAGVVAQRADFMEELVGKVTAALTTGAALDAFAAAVVDRVAADAALAQKVADATAGRAQAAPATAQAFADAVAGRAQANAATAQILADAVAGRAQATPATAQVLADAVAGRVQATTATAQVLADAVAGRVQATATTAQTLADAVASRVQATTATAQTVATAVAARVQATPATAQTVADAVASRAQATPATAQALADAIAARVTTTAATAQTITDAVAARVTANAATAQTIADAVAARVQATNTTADTFATRVVARVDATATLSATVAEIVVDEVEPGEGNFPGRLATSLVKQVEADPALRARLRAALGIVQP